MTNCRQESVSNSEAKVPDWGGKVDSGMARVKVDSGIGLPIENVL